jgi:hypothetical protein
MLVTNPFETSFNLIEAIFGDGSKKNEFIKEND